MAGKELGYAIWMLAVGLSPRDACSTISMNGTDKFCVSRREEEEKRETILTSGPCVAEEERKASLQDPCVMMGKNGSDSLNVYLIKEMLQDTCEMMEMDGRDGSKGLRGAE